MNSQSVISEIKDVLKWLRSELPMIIFFSIVLLGWIHLVSSDIAWVVGSHECEKQGFCYNIDSDQDAGTLTSIIVLSNDNALSNGWSEVQTTTGIYHIHGNPVVTHKKGDAVKLYASKGSQRNVLCINDTCYLVPFSKENI